MFLSVKKLSEQATSQRLHFAMSREGFGKGMNTFFPDSSNSLTDFGHLSAYLKSVLHSPQHLQCLVPTMLLPFRTLSQFLTKFSVVLCQFYSSRSYISFKVVAMFVWVCVGGGGLVGYHVTTSIFSNSRKHYYMTL